MAEERAQRRLAAILAADVVGYGRLMEQDEAGTFARLRAHRIELFEPAINTHHGRIFKLMGDGLLAEFGSVVDAVECASAMQQGMAERNSGLDPDDRIDLRIGINLGDVIVEGEDRHGEGVNISARLQTLADPGGILVSGSAYDQVWKKITAGFDDLGAQNLKNIAEPVRVYRLTTATRTLASRPSLALPDKPSIAVLPFENMSGDPEQEYFASGVVEEIITALSRFRGLFVIARNSSFTYKGRTVDVKQVGRELGVRYVLEGSVRKAADRLRITGQLVDASSGANLWADHFDGALVDVFDLQDQVATSVVGAVAPRLAEAEIERTKRKPSENLDAYDHYLRGLAVADRMTKEANDNALQHFYAAVERDPDFVLACARAALCYSHRKANGWMVDRSQEVAEAARLARRAVEVGRDDAVALSYGGDALAYVVGDLDDGAAFVDRALGLNPNLAAAWGFSSWMKVCFGEPDAAIKHAARAMRLSPVDSSTYEWQSNTALAHFCAGRYDDAASWAEGALREQPNYAYALRVAAAGHALAGRLTEARKAMARLRQAHPELRLSTLADVMSPLRRPEDRAKWVDGLRKAGLPE
jgi:TolB-like protein